MVGRKSDDDIVLIILKVYWIMFSRPMNSLGVRETFLGKRLSSDLMQMDTKPSLPHY